MSDPFYLPVDPPLPLKALRRLSEEQLRTRSLDDPKYAGFDPHFDWTRYIAVDIPDSPTRDKVAAELATIAGTEHGQQAIRQAYALRQVYLRMQHGKHAPQDATLHISYCAPDLSKSSVISHIEAERGGIVISGEDLAQEVRAKDGSYTPLLLGDILFHELDHLRDPLAILPIYAPWHKERHRAYAKATLDVINPYNHGKPVHSHRERRALFLSLSPEQQAAVRSAAAAMQEAECAVYEYPAIADTNRYIRDVEHKPERALAHDDSRLSSSIILAAPATEGLIFAPAAPTVTRDISIQR